MQILAIGVWQVFGGPWGSRWDTDSISYNTFLLPHPGDGVQEYTKCHELGKCEEKKDVKEKKPFW